jgi:hypothetical protein
VFTAAAVEAVLVETMFIMAEPLRLVVMAALPLLAIMQLQRQDQLRAVAEVQQQAHQQQLLAQSQAALVRVVKFAFGQLGDNHAKS